MKTSELVSQIIQKRSYLCVGLDTDVNKIPSHLGRDISSVLNFNREIIEATSEYAVAYKINTAFYEQYGSDGWNLMQDTLDLIPKECFTIADAKRGDIGNTGEMYARAFLENMSFDSITVNPYMGFDNVQPFLKTGKTVIMLGLTSNPGSKDFQFLKSDGKYLFEHVIKTASEWSDSDQMMFVVGATQTEMLARIRTLVPNHFLLIPGVGSQGGSLSEVSKFGLNERCGLLVNSSRAIIYASNDSDFAVRAGAEAKKMRDEMNQFLTLNHL